MDLATIESALGVANSAVSLGQSLFGGSKSESDSMKDQYAWNAYSTLMNPLFQVRGLRKAGLNPMLAVSKGLNSAAPVSSAPGSQDNAQTNRMLAVSTAANQAAQAKLYSAQSELVKNQSVTESVRPENVVSETNLRNAQKAVQESQKYLTDAMNRTEDQRSKKTLYEFHMQKLEYELAHENLDKRQKAEISKIVAEGRSAKTKADLDAVYSEIERIIGAGSEAVGAITGGISSAMRGLASGKQADAAGKQADAAVRRAEILSNRFRPRGR